MKNKNIVIKGVPLKVEEGVFDPSETNSSSMILNYLPDIKQKEVLDMGSGTGIISVYCALNGAKKILAADIDDRALENTRENVEMNGLGKKVKVVKSDLFKKVRGRFDYIFGNLPINDKSWNLSVSTVELMKKFLSEAVEHLKTGGKIYFTWNSDDGIEPVRAILREGGYNFKEKTEKKSDKTWYLFEVG